MKLAPFLSFGVLVVPFLVAGGAPTATFPDFERSYLAARVSSVTLENVRTWNFFPAKFPGEPWEVPAKIVALIPTAVRQALGCDVAKLTVMRNVDAVDLFAGRARITKWGTLGGLNVLPIDRTCVDHMDILTTTGLAIVIVALLRIKPPGLMFAGPQCSSWVWVSRSVTKRRRGNIMGNEACKPVQEGNEVNARMALLCYIANNLGVSWVIEQPRSPTFFETPNMQTLLVEIPSVLPLSINLGDYGHASMKPTLLVGVGALLEDLKMVGAKFAELMPGVALSCPEPAAKPKAHSKAKSKAKSKTAKSSAPTKKVNTAKAAVKKAEAAKLPLYTTATRPNGKKAVNGNKREMKQSQDYPMQFALSVMRHVAIRGAVHAASVAMYSFMCGFTARASAMAFCFLRSGPLLWARPPIFFFFLFTIGMIVWILYWMRKPSKCASRAARYTDERSINVPSMTPLMLNSATNTGIRASITAANLAMFLASRSTVATTRAAPCCTHCSNALCKAGLCNATPDSLLFTVATTVCDPNIILHHASHMALWASNVMGCWTAFAPDFDFRRNLTTWGAFGFFSLVRVCMPAVRATRNCTKFESAWRSFKGVFCWPVIVPRRMIAAAPARLVAPAKATLNVRDAVGHGVEGGSLYPAGADPPRARALECARQDSFAKLAMLAAAPQLMDSDTASKDWTDGCAAAVPARPHLAMSAFDIYAKFDLDPRASSTCPAPADGGAPRAACLCKGMTQSDLIIELVGLGALMQEAIATDLEKRVALAARRLHSGPRVLRFHDKVRPAQFDQRRTECSLQPLRAAEDLHAWQQDREEDYLQVECFGIRFELLPGFADCTFLMFSVAVRFDEMTPEATVWLLREEIGQDYFSAPSETVLGVLDGTEAAFDSDADPFAAEPAGSQSTPVDDQVARSLSAAIGRVAAPVRIDWTVHVMPEVLRLMVGHPAPPPAHTDGSLKKDPGSAFASLHVDAEGPFYFGTIDIENNIDAMALSHECWPALGAQRRELQPAAPTVCIRLAPLAAAFWPARAQRAPEDQSRPAPGPLGAAGSLHQRLTNGIILGAALAAIGRINEQLAQPPAPKLAELQSLCSQIVQTLDAGLAAWRAVLAMAAVLSVTMPALVISVCQVGTWRESETATDGRWADIRKRPPEPGPATSLGTFLKAWRVDLPFIVLPSARGKFSSCGLCDFLKMMIQTSPDQSIKYQLLLTLGAHYEFQGQQRLYLDNLFQESIRNPRGLLVIGWDKMDQGKTILPRVRALINTPFHKQGDRLVASLICAWAPAVLGKRPLIYTLLEDYARGPNMACALLVDTLKEAVGAIGRLPRRLCLNADNTSKDAIFFHINKALAGEDALSLPQLFAILSRRLRHPPHGKHLRDLDLRHKLR
ncbi:unnamed protein product [Prorocentrum cordatum]|uniref:Uncharacterized protein n=1 Tax=Prorocentrum cordatum TaxID=2364126 RepID=A0ABN9T0W9_9DINO|nr:unnamed protein product [Polarella glacialis]